MAQTADTIFRDFVTDGVPASGANRPAKAAIREWGTQLESLYAAAQAGGGLAYETKADLDADLAHDANQIAWVMEDPTAANNGIYAKVGASGSGSWNRLGDLPYSYIVASNAGAGTANAIVATTSIPIPAADGGALIALAIVADNTASPVTVAFNGGSPLTIKTSSGNDVSVGGLAAGMIAAGYVSGATFRLLTDQASAAILAGAEAAKLAAESAAGANLANADSVTAAEATNIPAPVNYIRTAGYIAAGDGGQALYERVDAEPSHDGKFQSADGAWWSLVEARPTPKQFGQVSGDGVTDDSVPFNAAAGYAIAKGLKSVVVGAGAHNIASPSRDLYKIVLEGEGSIAGAYCLPVRRSDLPTLQMPSGIDPIRHLPKLLERDSVTVVLVGDSLSTPFVPSHAELNDNLWGALQDWLRGAFPQKRFTFINRGVGGAIEYSLNYAPTAFPLIDWYPIVSTEMATTSGSNSVTVADATGMQEGWFLRGTGILKNTYITGISGNTLTISANATAAGAGVSCTSMPPWLDIIAGDEPDIVFRAFGMNDGHNWDIGNFQANISMLGQAKLKNIPSRPDIVNLTAVKPSLSTTDSNFNSFENQNGREAMAGYDRGESAFYGFGLIDVGRHFGALRDGRDVVGTRFEKVGALTQAMPLTVADTLVDFVMDVSVENIPADFFLLSSDSVLQVPLAPKNKSLLHIVKTDSGKLRWRVFGDAESAFALFRTTDIDAPATGATFTMRVRLRGNWLTLTLMGSLAYDGPIIRFGGEFQPYFMYSKNEAGPAASWTLYKGIPSDTRPTLTDIDIYGDPLGEDEVNGVNHSNSIANKVIYPPAFVAQAAYGQAIHPARRLLKGYNGIAIDGVTQTYAVAKNGVVTTGDLADIVDSWIGSITSFPAYQIAGYSAGMDIASGKGAVIDIATLWGSSISRCAIACAGMTPDNSTAALAALATTANNGKRVQFSLGSGTFATAVIADDLSTSLNVSFGEASERPRTAAVSLKNDDGFTACDGDYFAAATDGFVIPTALTTLKLGHSTSAGNTGRSVLTSLVIVPDDSAEVAMRLSL